MVRDPRHEINHPRPGVADLLRQAHSAVMSEATARFRQARDFLLAHREDYAEAYAQFGWPKLGAFNWALDWFDVIAEGNDSPALWIVEEDGSEQKFSFAEVKHRSDQVAVWLRAQGVARGDRVVLMLGNQVELWDTILAVMKLGAVLIPATPLLGPADARDRVVRGRAQPLMPTTPPAGHIEPVARVPPRPPTPVPPTSPRTG